MRNPFSNANTAVEAYSFNKRFDRSIDVMSDAAASNSALRKMQNEEREATFESTLIEKDKHDHYNKLNKGIVMRYVKESQIPNNINRISNMAKEYILKDILFEMFYNSLVMDDDFLRENCDCIKCLTDKYVDDNGGFEVLNKAIKSQFDHEFLKKIKSVCESVALEVCSRKLKDSKECGNIELIDFDMTEDEKNKLDYSKKEDLDIEKISELVKNKVLTVVKDEKERHEMNSELIDNIETDLKEDESVTDEKSLNEAMSKIVLSKSVIEESTLFDALFRDAYQEYITENVAIVSTDKQIIDDDKEMAKNYDTEMDVDDALNDDTDVEGTEVNMDLILTEAITKYTLMEMLYTIGLENYSHENIKKLTERMLNPVNESATILMENEDFIKIRGEFFKLFNKLKDDPSNETARDNLSKWAEKTCEDKENVKHCKSMIGIANSQIDSIIEKNPKMKDKYTDLSTFITELIK